jgi:hypothetical protein
VKSPELFPLLLEKNVMPAKAGIHTYAFNVSYKSIQAGLAFSVSVIFHFRRHFLSVDSRFRGNDIVRVYLSEGTTILGR